MRYNSTRNLRHLRFGAGVAVGGGGLGGGGGGGDDADEGAEGGEVVLDGGVVWTRLGGGGGTFGTFSGGIVDAEDGVLGVEEDAGPGAGLTGPGGTVVFTGACELADPGMKAGSELKIDPFVLPVDFGASAKYLCIMGFELANSTHVVPNWKFPVPGRCTEIVIPRVDVPESSQPLVQAAMPRRYTGPSAA